MINIKMKLKLFYLIIMLRNECLHLDTYKSEGFIMKKGLFIVFEGGEGTGKTTAIDSIYNWITENNFQCIKTREPGGIKISEQIRQVILNTDNIAMDSKTEALLYTAARRQHLVEKVIPALESGIIVLCDRFIDSSLAYQGYAKRFRNRRSNEHKSICNWRIYA